MKAKLIDSSCIMNGNTFSVAPSMLKQRAVSLTDNPEFEGLNLAAIGIE